MYPFSSFFVKNGSELQAKKIEVYKNIVKKWRQIEDFHQKYSHNLVLSIRYVMIEIETQNHIFARLKNT